MFHKEGSYKGGSGSKKAKDTPMKKSDRRKLRSDCLSLLRVGFHHNDTNNNGNDDDNGNDNDNNVLSALLDSIFLDSKGDIFIRKIKQPNAQSNAGATTFYIRTPTTAATSTNNIHSSTSSSINSSELLTQWPYTKKDQAILISIQSNSNTTNNNNKNYLLPTVALLSTLPLSIIHTLPTVIVPSQVSKYLCRGAHLMKSGMLSIQNVNFHNDTTHKEEQQQQWVCVCVQNNPQPFAIGFLTKDTTNDNILGSRLLYNNNHNNNNNSNINNGNNNTSASTSKGIGVQIISCYGDDLFHSQTIVPSSSSSSKTKSSEIVASFSSSLGGGGCFDDGHYGNIGFDNGQFVHGFMQIDDHNNYTDDDSNDNGNETLKDHVKQLTIQEKKDDDNNNDEQNQNKTTCTDTNNENNNCNKDNNRNVKNVNEQEKQDDEQNEQEQILLEAFYKSLLIISPKKDLPMTIATYYAQYLLPSRKENTFLDIKQTKYKKITTFLLEQQSQSNGLIQLGPSKDRSDPVAFLIGINRTHVDLRDARRRYKQELQGTNNNNSGSGGTSSGSGSLTSKKKMAIVKLYIIPHKIANLLQLDEDLVKAKNAKSEQRKGTGFLTLPECREILSQYIQENDLEDEDDKQNIILNGPLCDALFRKSKKEISINAQHEFPECITRKDLFLKWIEKMDDAYATVSMPGSVIVSMKRGKQPMITIEVEARQSRKKFITRVRGLEEYAIDSSDFANDVSKRFACSASVEDEHSLSAGRPLLKKGCFELVFQGHLIEELQALLTGDEKRCSHGGTKGSSYCLPKGIFDIILRKGVPSRRK